jgi:hypothetical protein
MRGFSVWSRLALWYLRNRKTVDHLSEPGWKVPQAVKIGPEFFEESMTTEHTPWLQLQALASLLRAPDSPDER